MYSFQTTNYIATTNAYYDICLQETVKNNVKQLQTITITKPRIATVMYKNPQIGRLCTTHDRIIIEYSPSRFHSAHTLHRRDEIECVSFKSNKNRESTRNSESDDDL